MRRAVHLFEGREDPLPMLRSDARTGIRDRKGNGRLVPKLGERSSTDGCGRWTKSRTSPAFGELDRVAYEVRQDLVEALSVGRDRLGQSVRDLDDQT